MVDAHVRKNYILIFSRVIFKYPSKKLLQTMFKNFTEILFAQIVLFVNCVNP